MLVFVVLALNSMLSASQQLFSMEGDCDVLIFGTYECVSSTGYPNWYSDLSYCEITLGNVPVLLDWRGFHTEWIWDALTLIDVDSDVSYTYSGECCLVSLTSNCSWNTASVSCGSFVERLPAFSVITWSSDSSVDFSGWRICMLEDPDGTVVQVDEDETTTVVIFVLLGMCLACGCCVMFVCVMFFFCMRQKSPAPVPATVQPSVVQASAAQASVAQATVVPATTAETEDNPDQGIPPADNQVPSTGEEDNPEAGLPKGGEDDEWS